MVLSMAMSVSATGTDNAALVLEVGNGKGSVTVDVYLEAGTGITNGQFAVTYDAETLTLVEVLVSDAYAVSSVNDKEAGTVSLAWVGSELTAEKTLMLTLKLEIADGATGSVTYTAQNAGCYTDTEAVQVADTSVTVAFDAAVDTTELEKAIAEAQAVEGAGYTAESFAALEKALAEAIAVLANSDATQEEVNAATKALKDAIAGLKTPDGTVNTSKLEAAVAEAEKLDKSLYTKDSYAAVEKALENAKAVLADEDATQAQVDAATKALKDAMAALKKDDGSADTGDRSKVWLWAIILVVSLIAAIVLIVAMVRSGKGKQVTRCLAILLVASMLLTAAPVTGLAIVDGEDRENKGFLENLKDILKGDSLIVKGEDDSFIGTVKQVFDRVLNLKADQKMDTMANLYDAEDMVRILVELEGDCLLEQGFTRNQISQFGPKVAAATAALETLQDYTANEIAKLASDAKLEAPSVKYHYTAAMNGLAMTVPYGILAQIQSVIAHHKCICRKHLIGVQRIGKIGNCLAFRI